MWGAFVSNWYLAAVAVVGVVLSAGYFLWYYERAFFGPPGSAKIARLLDLNARETAVMAATLALIVAIGLYPAPLLNMTSASTEALTKRLESRNAAVAQLEADNLTE